MIGLLVIQIISKLKRQANFIEGMPIISESIVRKLYVWNLYFVVLFLQLIGFCKSVKDPLVIQIELVVS